MKESERMQVLEFLKNYVIGRSIVAAPVRTHTDRGQLTSAYEEDAVFSGLSETANGFSFDMTVLARGTRYVPEKSGLLAEATLNAVRVLRYEMTERLSSHKLVGFARFASTTNCQPDPLSGGAFLVRMRVDGYSLVLHESQVGYVDSMSADGSFKPFAVDGKATFVIEQNALVVRYEQETFDVDPHTFARKPTGDKFPVQVSREVQFPAPLVAA
jgi:hypothetical protein